MKAGRRPHADPALGLRRWTGCWLPSTTTCRRSGMRWHGARCRRTC
jgi:hypothetical protein